MKKRFLFTLNDGSVEIVEARDYRDAWESFHFAGRGVGRSVVSMREVA